MNFQQLQADGVFCGVDIDKELVRFCLMDIVQVRPILFFFFLFFSFLIFFIR